MNGTYKRTYYDVNGHLYEDGYIAQLRCRKCNKTHAWIPSFLYPYYIPCAELIEEAINGFAKVKLDSSHVSKLKKTFQKYGDIAVGFFQSQMPPVSVIHLNGKPINEQLEFLLERFEEVADEKLKPPADLGKDKVFRKACYTMTRHNGRFFNAKPVFNFA